MSKEMRKAYQEAVTHLMRQDSKVVMLDADLASASGSGAAFKEFPNQCINCGISEANMISAACGMSLAGLKPFVHTFAPFATRRVFDQLYMSGAFSQNSIHVFGSEPGIWAVFNGGTHTTFEDLALTRTLPNSVVCAPCDVHQFKFIVNEYYQTHKLFYTRSCRGILEDVYHEETHFQLGKWILHNNLSEDVVICIGEMVQKGLRLQKEFSNVCVIDAFCLNPYDQKLLSEIAKKAKRVLVCENHSQFGGLGELVARELALNNYQGKFAHVAIAHHVSEVGTYEFLEKKFKLDYESIKEKYVSMK